MTYNKNTRRSYTQTENNCHAELVSASTPLIMGTDKEDIVKLHGREPVEFHDDNKRHGFTLIELLVVVLIIGILAAVALPQYQKAVRRSKTVELNTTLNALEKNIEMYLLANGFPTAQVYFTGQSGFNNSTKAEGDIGISGVEQWFGTATKIGKFEASCDSSTCLIKFNSERAEVNGVVQQQKKWIPLLNVDYSPNTGWKLRSVQDSDTALAKELCVWWPGKMSSQAKTNCQTLGVNVN